MNDLNVKIYQNIRKLQSHNIIAYIISLSEYYNVFLYEHINI